MNCQKVRNVTKGLESVTTVQPVLTNMGENWDANLHQDLFPLAQSECHRIRTLTATSVHSRCLN